MLLMVRVLGLLLPWRARSPGLSEEVAPLDL